jgi:hypothetical protein
MNPSNPRPIINASDLSQYAYCPRGWWLARVEGRTSANQAELAYGRLSHRRHGLMTALAVTLQRAAYVLIGLGLLGLALLLIYAALAGGA